MGCSDSERDQSRSQRVIFAGNDCRHRVIRRPDLRLTKSSALDT